MSLARPPTSAAAMRAASTQITGMGLSDGFRTGRLPDGRLMSTTGDTTRPGESLPAYDNSIVIWDRAGQRRVSTPGDPYQNFFPRWPDGSEFWPYQWATAGPASTTVYATGSRQLVVGPYEWTTLGAYGAVLSVPANDVPMFLRYFDTPSSGQGDAAVQWSAGLVRDGGYLYVHGVLDRPDLYHSRDGGYLARVPVAGVEVHAGWRFWTGTEWLPGVPAVSTIPTQPVGGTEATYTVHRRPNGDWTVTTKRNGTLANVIGRYIAPTPQGPWTWEPLLTTCDLDCYLSGAAAGVPTVSGKLLIQWSRAGDTPDWAEVEA